MKVPAIKLFGKTIPLLPKQQVSKFATAITTHVADDEQQLSSTSEPSTPKICNRVADYKKSSEIEVTETRLQDDTSHPNREEEKNPETTCDNQKTQSAEKEPSSPEVSKNEEQSETSISEGKTLKKPDKILPCPRCNSMDTKFCYYNNYNVNQPRHFCKNCQRYWTAGGTTRNVPVGSGRRKNKSSPALHYRHITVSECLEAARGNVVNGINYHPNNGVVLNFGSGLNLAEEKKISVSSGGKENGDRFCVSDSAEKGRNCILQESVVSDFQTLPSQVRCFPGPPWPNFPIVPPAFTPSGFPIAFYPTPAYWGYTLPGSWGCTLPDPAMYPTPRSPTLGKHSRDDEEPLKENNSERGVWIPKTLRIDDPNEAAKSSIWLTLGIKKDKNDLINGGGFFKAFQSEEGEKKHVDETSLALQANPAALSRSFNFHERV